MADYIEREKLLELLKNRKKDYPMEAWQKCNYEGGWHDAVDQIEEDIKSVPAADVVPVVHGLWEPDSRRIGLHYCNICKSEAITQEDSWGYPYDETLSDFCPWCGTKMDGKDGEHNAQT